jgi:hypothetical protein
VLLVAAGGGGDVIGAVMVAEALGLSPADAIVASVAWERLLVDPVPGPRAVGDFDGLVRRGDTFEVVPTTRARHPYGSLLPDVRRDLGFPLYLLDPHRGVVGLAEQLRALLRFPDMEVDRDLWLVDVGGDVLATGSELGLSSPLCDALMLAATVVVNAEAPVLIAGPGLDGELTRTEVATRLAETNATLLLTLPMPSEQVSKVLEWHPTEASALLAASSMGIRGKVEIRDAGSVVELDDDSAQVWVTSAQAAVETSRLASGVLDSASLHEADLAVREIATTELELEEGKAARVGEMSFISQPIDKEALDQVSLLEARASRQGIDFTTFRRLAEYTHRSAHRQQLRAALIAKHPERLNGPLWRLR